MSHISSCDSASENGFVSTSVTIASGPRAGRALRPPEMEASLRQMEATPPSGQRAHGRPTYVERLFGRR